MEPLPEMVVAVEAACAGARPPPGAAEATKPAGAGPAPVAPGIVAAAATARVAWTQPCLGTADATSSGATPSLHLFHAPDLMLPPSSFSG